MRKILLAIAVAALAACATTSTDGPVEIAPNTYMLGGLGGFTDFSGSAVKARYVADGQKFCAAKGRQFHLIDSSGKDSGLATYASAEVQFRCDAQ